jgi:hypothetical protein
MAAQTLDIFTNITLHTMTNIVGISDRFLLNVTKIATPLQAEGAITSTMSSVYPLTNIVQ